MKQEFVGRHAISALCSSAKSRRCGQSCEASAAQQEVKSQRRGRPALRVRHRVLLENLGQQRRDELDQNKEERCRSQGRQLFDEMQSKEQHGSGAWGRAGRPSTESWQCDAEHVENLG